MKHLQLAHILAFFILGSSSIYAQQLGQLMAAQDYHEMKSGPEKTERIRNLERKGWYHQDELMDHTGNFIETKKFDLSPFVDSLGEPVFLVTDVSPEFPGGSDNLTYYFRNILGNLLARSIDETHNTLFIKFSVLKDGKIAEVEPANPFPDWVRSSTRQKCLSAVREMTNWSPGNFKGQSVKVKMLMIFNLRE